MCMCACVCVCVRAHITILCNINHYKTSIVGLGKLIVQVRYVISSLIYLPDVHNITNTIPLKTSHYNLFELQKYVMTCRKLMTLCDVGDSGLYPIPPPRWIESKFYVCGTFHPRINGFGLII